MNVDQKITRFKDKEKGLSQELGSPFLLH